MSSKSKSHENMVFDFYNERGDHLKHPIPESMEVRPIGKAITHNEWEKFSKRYLTPKLHRECEHRMDGTVIFHGEGGLDVAVLFQNHFKNRFRLRMICASMERTIEGLQLAKERELTIHEVHFKNGRKEKIKLNGSNLVDQMMASVTHHAA